MSRIGKHAVPVPSGVTVDVAGQVVSAKGPKGQLSLTVADELDATLADGKITVRMRADTRRARALWGMQRSLVNNLVNGVAKGFTSDLEISGVGFRANLQGKNLVLQLGFSHEIHYAIPADIDVKVDKQTQIKISGADRQLVGQVAADIRAFRPPEPYKGKGIKYAAEFVRRKEGKKK
jgi:large subunit ribosomal protein L6